MRFTTGAQDFGPAGSSDSLGNGPLSRGWFEASLRCPILETSHGNLVPFRRLEKRAQSTDDIHTDQCPRSELGDASRPSHSDANHQHLSTPS